MRSLDYSEPDSVPNWGLLGTEIANDRGYLEFHGVQWRVQVKIPKPVRAALGKAKLVEPLHTSSLALRATADQLGRFDCSVRTGDYAGAAAGGRRAARQQGKYKGRQPTARAKGAQVLALKTQGKGASEIATALGIERASVYHILAELPKRDK